MSQKELPDYNVRSREPSVSPQDVWGSGIVPCLVKYCSSKWLRWLISISVWHQCKLSKCKKFNSDICRLFEPHDAGMQLQVSLPGCHCCSSEDTVISIYIYIYISQWWNLTNCINSSTKVKLLSKNITYTNKTLAKPITLHKYFPFVSLITFSWFYFHTFTKQSEVNGAFLFVFDYFHNVVVVGHILFLKV